MSSSNCVLPRKSAVSAPSFALQAPKNHERPRKKLISGFNFSLQSSKILFTTGKTEFWASILALQSSKIMVVQGKNVFLVSIFAVQGLKIMVVPEKKVFPMKIKLILHYCCVPKSCTTLWVACYSCFLMLHVPPDPPNSMLQPDFGISKNVQVPKSCTTSSFSRCFP